MKCVILLPVSNSAGAGCLTIQFPNDNDMIQHTETRLLLHWLTDLSLLLVSLRSLLTSAEIMLLLSVIREKVRSELESLASRWRWWSLTCLHNPPPPRWWSWLWLDFLTSWYDRIAISKSTVKVVSIVKVTIISLEIQYDIRKRSHERERSSDLLYEM